MILSAWECSGTLAQLQALFPDITLRDADGWYATGTDTLLLQRDAGTDTYRGTIWHTPAMRETFFDLVKLPMVERHR